MVTAGGIMLNLLIKSVEAYTAVRCCWSLKLYIVLLQFFKIIKLY